MREDSSEVSEGEADSVYERLEEALSSSAPGVLHRALGQPLVPLAPIDPRNVFAQALEPESDRGVLLTEAEFSVAVFQLMADTGQITSAIVERVRRDWEALSALAPHPATEEARDAYAAFVEEYGLLPLIETLFPNLPGAPNRAQ